MQRLEIMTSPSHLTTLTFIVNGKVTRRIRNLSTFPPLVRALWATTWTLVDVPYVPHPQEVPRDSAA